MTGFLEEEPTASAPGSCDQSQSEKEYLREKSEKEYLREKSEKGIEGEI